jgi:hypothetical protein
MASLPLKNTLLEPDARVVEAVYQTRLEDAARPAANIVDQAARSTSPPCWPIPPANGSPRIGRGRGANLCAPLCLFALVGIAGEDDLDAPDAVVFW